MLASRKTVSITSLAPSPNGASTSASNSEAKAPRSKGKTPVLTWAAR